MRISGPSIEERIRSMVRADYDNAVVQNVPEQQLPNQVAFFRIMELARFWDDPQFGRESLAERQQALITSLYGMRTPWTYVVLGEGGLSSAFIGLPCDESGLKSCEQLLAAQFPGSSWRQDRSASEIIKSLARFQMVAALSGNPSIVSSDERHADMGLRSAGIESLFETLAGVRWGYMVFSRPLTDQELTDDLHGIESELQEMLSSRRRRGSGEETNNPMVSRYISLLESANQKLIQGQRHGMWEVQSYLFADSKNDCQRGTQALYAALGGPSSEPQPFRIKTGSRNGVMGLGVPMTTRLNTKEVTAMAGLPRREVAGLQVVDHVQYGMTGGDVGGHGVALGKIMSGGTCTSRWYEVQLDSLCKHIFIAGVPGSGKTRTCLYILSQIWREHGMPWLVLEPSMKSEYRTLLNSAMGSALRVFTAGDESGSPLRLNPLEIPDGVHVQTHIGGLATIFKAAFAMDAPLPYVLDEALYRVYKDRGWNFITGTHPSREAGCQPTLSDLLETCDKVIHDLEHEERVKANIKGAIKTRLTSLMRGAKGLMLNVRHSHSMEWILSAPTVIEFSAIGDDDEKAFLLGCILLKLAQHRQAQGLSASGLRHVTLIEEAHRLLRNVPESTGTSAANPRRQAVEAFSNMLAELRAFGEGLVVVDQMPSKLVPDVIRNSAIKIVHRLTAEEERTIVGGAMALNEGQTRFLTRLAAGQAIVYTDGSVNACRVCMPDHAGSEGYLKKYPSKVEVRERMQRHIQPDCGASAMDPTGTAISGETLRRCMNTCPAETCMAKSAIDRYARQHSGQLEASFQMAMTEGFDSMWRYGARIAQSIWPEEGPMDHSPFCVVMTVAGKMGMTEQDLLVLRRNMSRLSSNQRKGGRS